MYLLVNCHQVFFIFAYIGCPVKGQVRRLCASDPSCHRTCTSGILPCPLICIVGGCECPKGTVINEDLNMCVTLDKCDAGMITSTVICI